MSVCSSLHHPINVAAAAAMMRWTWLFRNLEHLLTYHVCQFTVILNRPKFILNYTHWMQSCKPHYYSAPLFYITQSTCYLVFFSSSKIVVVVVVVVVVDAVVAVVLTVEVSGSVLHLIQYRHNVTRIGAVPGSLTDAPFNEGYHGWPMDASNLGCLMSCC